MPLMFDSTNYDAIPSSAPIVSYYIDGLYQPTSAQMERFASTPKVSITVLGHAGARVADIELGDLTPASGAMWAANEIKNGRRPTLYFSLSVWDEVISELGALGISRSAVDYWVADWTGHPHIVPGSVATQFANPPASGGDYDTSMTIDGWPHSITPPPAPPAPTQELTWMPTSLPVLKIGPLKTGWTANLQVLLNGHGHGLAVDGIFGPQTAAAVEAVQATLHLTIDGIVGPQTWAGILSYR